MSAFEKWSLQTAVAERGLEGLAAMGTMVAVPVEVRCVSRGEGEDLGSGLDGLEWMVLGVLPMLVVLVVLVV